MCELLKDNLLEVKHRTISKDELEALAPFTESYEAFAKEVLALEKADLLEMVKAQGRSTRKPSLAHQYRINKHKLNHTYHRQLQTYRMKFNNAISLDAYFALNSTTFQQDLPHLEKINNYIEANGLPAEKVAAPERSFELFGDEKFIEEKGKKLLSRINLWEGLNIFPVTEPLRFAMNPARVEDARQLHLIVENKTTFQALMEVLGDTLFATLIYGQGNNITSNMENFSIQYPVEASHTFIYFGDIDRSGIDIWHRLYQHQASVMPALPFYEACLRKAQAYGKTNQRAKEEAIRHFISFFSEESKKKITQVLQEGAYYPQEVLQTEELQHIFITADWTGYLT